MVLVSQRIWGLPPVFVFTPGLAYRLTPRSFAPAVLVYGLSNATGSTDLSAYLSFALADRLAVPDHAIATSRIEASTSTRWSIWASSSAHSVCGSGRTIC